MVDRRVTDGHRFPRFRAWYARWGRDIVTMIAVGLAAFSVGKVVKEARERQDQLCTIAERKQLADVRQLHSTYDYLAKKVAQDIDPNAGVISLNDILASLPQVEEDAFFDDAPEFCDEPGVGLPEPDPEIPTRPFSLRPELHDSLFRQRP